MTIATDFSTQYLLESVSCDGMYLTPASDGSVQLQNLSGDQSSQQWLLTAVQRLDLSDPYIGFTIMAAGGDNAGMALKFNGAKQPLSLVPFDERDSSFVWIPLYTTAQSQGFTLACWQTVHNVGTVIDIVGGKCTSGAQVQSYGSNASTSQYWRVVSSSSETTE